MSRLHGQASTLGSPRNSGEPIIASLRARLVNLALPLLGIKRFFSEPEKMDSRIAKLREKDSIRPRGKWHRRLDISESTSHGYAVVTITPKGGAKPGAPHILNLHGGGYVMDIAAVHWDSVAKLCEDLGASATVPIYPLAPEVTAAQTIPAMRALYGELAERYGADTITVMGDSAGGGMSLALAQVILAEVAECAIQGSRKRDFSFSCGLLSTTELGQHGQCRLQILRSRRAHPRVAPS